VALQEVRESEFSQREFFEQYRVGGIAPGLAFRLMFVGPANMQEHPPHALG
jgi:hypothetical protein